MKSIPEDEGRSAFGKNVRAYNEARPPYPEWVFNLLVQQKALYRGARTLEIGPGNGLATRKIVELGASPLTLVEPDDRFALLLNAVRDHEGRPCRIVHKPFEDTQLPASSFDFVIVATSFHWLDPLTRVEKLAKLTRSGGAVALLWNVFQDLNLPDPFHEATKEMLAKLSNSPSGKPDGLPFALDRQARESEFTATNDFELRMFAESHWKLILKPSDVRSLYAGFSNISRLPVKERTDLLNRLESVARSKFGGRVERNMTSPLYIFSRT